MAAKTGTMFAVAVGLLLVAALVAAQDPCGGNFGSNAYNLTEFKVDYNGYSITVDNYIYVLSVCQAIDVTPCSSNGGGTETQVCQTWPPYSNSDCKFLAKTTPTPTYSELSPSGSGIAMTLNGGKYSDTCDKDNSVVVNFHCDPSVTVVPPVFTGTNPVECVATFEVTHAWACPGYAAGGGGAFGWVVVCLIVFGFAIYFGAGIVYNKKKHGATGLDMLPQSTFWRAFPGHVKDGFAYTAGLVMKPCRKSRSYSEI